MASVETKAKISASKKGHVTSEETRAKISAAMKGRQISEETRAKMAEAQRGKHASQETREKLRELGKLRKGSNLLGGWNKGLTKVTSEGVRKQAEHLHEAHMREEVTVWCKGLSRATDERLAAKGDKTSDTLNKKVAAGTWHNSFAHSRVHEYHGHRLYGSWEVAVARHLDLTGIRWERPTASFPYSFEGVERRYTPDFYLPDQDLYIEVKGYATSKDLAKWAAFKNALRIYLGEDLVRLGLINTARKTKFDPEELVNLGFIHQDGWEKSRTLETSRYISPQEPKSQSYLITVIM